MWGTVSHRLFKWHPPSCTVESQRYNVPIIPVARCSNEGNGGCPPIDQLVKCNYCVRQIWYNRGGADKF